MAVKVDEGIAEAVDVKIVHGITNLERKGGDLSTPSFIERS